MPKPQNKSVILALIMGSCFVASVHAENLHDIYQLALKNDPVYEIGRHEKEASSEVYSQARALLLPQASFEISRSSIRQEILSADNTVFASGKARYPQGEYLFKLSQSIFDPAKWNAFSKAKIEVKRLAIELEALRQELAQRTVERYLTVLAASERLEYIRAEKKSVERQLDLSKAKYKRGLIRKSDYQEAQARVLATRSREIELENRMNDSLLGLTEIIGQLPDTLSLVAADMSLSRPDPSDPDAWVKVAREQNPEILAKKYAIQEAEKEVLRHKAGHFPTLDMTADVGRRDTDGTLFGGGSDVETTEIKLTLSVPIFAGGAVVSRTKAAVERHSKAKVELILVHRQVERDARAAYDNVMNAIAKVESIGKLVEAHEELARTQSIGYESGLTSSVDVLDAERDLFFSRSEYSRARHEYIANILRLKRAAGTLGESDIQQVNQMFLTDESQLPLSDFAKASYMSAYK